MTVLFPVRAASPVRPFRVFPLRLSLFSLACLLLLFSAGCSGNKEKEAKSGQKKKAAVMASVAASVKKTLPLEVAATGHIEALDRKSTRLNSSH